MIIQKQFNQLILLLSLLLCSFFLFFGCATIGSHLEQPKISIADIQVKELKTLEGVFVIELRVLNPNDIELNIRGVTCELELDGRHFATGIANTDHIVPAYGTTIIPVNVYASMFDMVASVVDLIQTSDPASPRAKPMEYSLTGKVRIASNGFQKNMPFVSKGELSLKGLGHKR